MVTVDVEPFALNLKLELLTASGLELIAAFRRKDERRKDTHAPREDKCYCLFSISVKACVSPQSSEIHIKYDFESFRKDSVSVNQL